MPSASAPCPLLLPLDPDPEVRTETLPAGQCLRLVDGAGRPLLEVTASDQGPVFRLMTNDLCLEQGGALRIAADRLELSGGRGGVHVQSEGDLRLHGRGDTVVTSRIIALNPPEGQSFRPSLAVQDEG